MKQFPLLTAFWNFLSAPSLPALSLSIGENRLVLLSLRYRHREFEPRQVGMVRLPAGIVQPGFAQPNVRNEDSMLDWLNRLKEQAGLKNIGKLNVSLPPGSTRSFIVNLDSEPGSKAELAQLIEWKIERATGYKVDSLRISQRRLRDFQGRPQWMVSAVHEEVISQYESLFARLGWKVGLIVPRHLGEAAWLARTAMEEDQMLISLHERGFDVVVIRRGEPILIREVECAPEDVDDEFYRLAIFYRDRLVPPGEPVNLNRVLTVGSPADQQRFRELVSAAIEKSTVSLTPVQLGLRLDPGMTFPDVAAAAGLSTMAWAG